MIDSDESAASSDPPMHPSMSAAASSVTSITTSTSGSTSTMGLRRGTRARRPPQEDTMVHPDLPPPGTPAGSLVRLYSVQHIMQSWRYDTVKRQFGDIVRANKVARNDFLILADIDKLISKERLMRDEFSVLALGPLPRSSHLPNQLDSIIAFGLLSLYRDDSSSLDYCVLSAYSVHPYWQGRKVGKRIVEEVISRLESRGRSSCQAEVHIENKGSYFALKGGVVANGWEISQVSVRADGKMNEYVLWKTGTLMPHYRQQWFMGAKPASSDTSTGGAGDNAGGHGGFPTGVSDDGTSSISGASSSSSGSGGGGGGKGRGNGGGGG